MEDGLKMEEPDMAKAQSTLLPKTEDVAELHLSQEK